MQTNVIQYKKWTHKNIEWNMWRELCYETIDQMVAALRNVKAIRLKLESKKQNELFCCSITSKAIRL